MINLKMQIVSLIFSFLYGVGLFIVFRYSYKYYFSKKKIKNILRVLLFCLSFSLLYFYILLKINNGVLHFYFLLLIIFGFLLTYSIYKKHVKST